MNTNEQETQQQQQEPQTEEPKPYKGKPKKTYHDKYKHKGTTDPAKNLFVRMQQTEEGRKLWKIWTDRRFIAPNGKRLGRPRGSIDGYTGHEVKQMRAKAKTEAKLMVAYMERKGFEVPKGEYAREAIEAAVETMRMDAINVKDKLSAARLVLEFTMAKPAAQTELTVKKAEDFLADIAEEMDKDK